jgi:uncharacterized membrane protein YdbT with pleckstrin-like domain
MTRFSQDQLQQNERILVDLNPHWVILMLPFIEAVLASIIFGTIALFIALRLHHSWGYWVFIFMLPSYLRFAWRVIERFNIEYVITNQRVVIQRGVFNKNSFDAPAEKINNVFHRQSIYGRLWNYGEVGLETASEQGTTLFTWVPDPVGFKNTIMTSLQETKQLRVTAPTPIAQDIPTLIHQLQELKEKGIITPEEFDKKKQELLSRL